MEVDGAGGDLCVTAGEETMEGGIEEVGGIEAMLVGRRGVGRRRGQGPGWG